MTINPLHISTMQSSTWESSCVKEESIVKSPSCTMFEDRDNEHNIKRSDNGSSFGNEELDSKTQEDGKTQNIFFYLLYSSLEKHAQIIYQFGLDFIAFVGQILNGVVRLINFSVKCVTEIAFLSVHLIENLKFKIILYQNYQPIQTQVIHHHHYHYPNVSHIVSG